MCAQRRLRSACAFAQSDLSLRCAPEDAFALTTTECPVVVIVVMVVVAVVIVVVVVVVVVE